MGVLFDLIGKASAGGFGGRKVKVSSRLDQYVAQIARDVEPPSQVTYVIDKNYEVVYTSPSGQK